MILVFSGDPFLARRAARAALRERGVGPAEVVVFGEGLDPADVERAAAQGGLFGPVALFLDFDEAFSGQAGVEPRKQALACLERLDPAALVVVLDSTATPARQKRYRALGTLRYLPTPRFQQLPRWIAGELEAAGVACRRDVPATLADLFGEDPAAIVAEIAKLAVLDETVDSERVRFLANRPAARTSFDLIERVADGDAAGALDLAHALLERGEAPQRVLGALAWQFGLVAKAVGLRATPGSADAGAAARTLGAPAGAARRAMAIAARFDETTLRTALHLLLDADTRAKGSTGADAGWALEGAVVALARRLAAAPRRAQPASSGPGDSAR